MPKVKNEKWADFIKRQLSEREHNQSKKDKPLGLYDALDTSKLPKPLGKKIKPKPQPPIIPDIPDVDGLDWDEDASKKERLKDTRKSKTQAGIPEDRYNLTELGVFMGGYSAKEVGKLLDKNGLRNSPKEPSQLAFDNGCAEMFKIDVFGVHGQVKTYYWVWENTRDFLSANDEEFRYRFNEFTVKNRLDEFRKLMDSGKFDLGETLYSNLFDGIAERDIPTLKHIFGL